MTPILAVKGAFFNRAVQALERYAASDSFDGVSPRGVEMEGIVWLRWIVLLPLSCLLLLGLGGGCQGAQDPWSVVPKGDCNPRNVLSAADWDLFNQKGGAFTCMAIQRLGQSLRDTQLIWLTKDGQIFGWDEATNTFTANINFQQPNSNAPVRSVTLYALRYDVLGIDQIPAQLSSLLRQLYESSCAPMRSTTYNCFEESTLASCWFAITPEIHANNAASPLQACRILRAPLEKTEESVSEAQTEPTIESQEPVVEPQQEQGAEDASESIPESLQEEPTQEQAQEPTPDAPPDQAECLEGAGRPCYPTGVSGCQPDAQGDYQCLGRCNAGIERCNEQGRWSGLCEAAIQPSQEVCNNQDDDCDGMIDNSGVNPLREACYTGAQGCQRDSDGLYVCVGSCRSGVRLCQNGVWGACSGEVSPAANDQCAPAGNDDNCNGIPNDGCACVSGSQRSCYSGDQSALNVGECRAGNQICDDAHGSWDFCLGEVTPSPEVCDGKDNDCDGQIDEGLTKESYTQGTSGCTLLSGGVYACVGACQSRQESCQSGQWMETRAMVTPGSEFKSCFDGMDNDCDGFVDFADNQNTVTQHGRDVCSGIESPLATQGSLTLRDIVSDEKGHFYVLGEFAGTITLSRQGQSVNFSTSTTRGIVLKVDPMGQILWAFPFGESSSGIVSPTAMAYQGGYLYITGRLFNTANFSTKAGNKTLGSQNTFSMFLVSLQEVGTSPPLLLEWAQSLPSLQGSEGNAIAVKGTDIFVGGRAWGRISLNETGTLFRDTMGLDPVLFKFTTLSAYKAGAVFPTTEIATEDRIRSIQINSQDEVIAVGDFTNAISVKVGLQVPRDMNAQGKRDAFVLKMGNNLSSNGDGVLWFARIHSVDDDIPVSVALDPNDEIYVTGDSVGTGNISFTQSTTSPQKLSKFGDRSMFLVKLNTQGNLQWLRGGGHTSTTNPNEAAGYALRFHNNGLFVLGGFKNKFSFYDQGAQTPPPAQLTNSNATQAALVLLHLTPQGVLSQARPLPHSPSAQNPREYKNLFSQGNWFSPAFAFDAYGVEMIILNENTQAPLTASGWDALTSFPSALAKGIFPRP